MEPPGTYEISLQAMQQLSGVCDSVCWATKEKRQVNGKDLSGGQSILETAQQALLDRSVGGLIVTIDEPVDLSSGWPFSYCDRFIEADDNQWQSDGKLERDRLRREIHRTLKPNEVLIADIN